MNNLLDKAKSFFIKHAIWMHVTAILLLSYALMKMSYRDQAGANMYMGWVLGLFLFSLPPLLFVYLRDQIKWEYKLKYWVSWFLLFLLYPALLFLLQIDLDDLSYTSFLFNNDISGEYAYLSLAAIFIGIEIILFLHAQRGNKHKGSLWIAQLSVCKLALVVVALFCLFMLASNNFVQDYLEGKSLLERAFSLIYCYLLLFISYFSSYIYYYIHHHVLYNGILKERGFIPYVIGWVLTVLLVAPIQNFLIRSLPMVSDLKLHTTGLTPMIYDELHFGLPILVLLGSFPLIVIIEWYKQVHTLNELEQQQTQTELSLLRQQINPHFFFNTLNNLYAMSLNQEKETPETILKLSELMRYVIYQGKEELVSLTQEINYIRDYIDLQLIRISHPVDLSFDTQLEEEQLEIPPLLFIILVENAFKHGVEASGTASLLHVSIKQTNEHLIFNCINSKATSSSSHAPGIGLENLKKRLQLLYPDRHTLILKDEGHRFSAQLTLYL